MFKYSVKLNADGIENMNDIGDFQADQFPVSVYFMVWNSIDRKTYSIPVLFIIP